MCRPTRMSASAVVAGLFLPLAGSPLLAWQPEVFPIGYWHGPPPTANNLETWRTVREANFTFAGPRGGYTAADNRKMLDLCRQVGLKAMVVDRRLSWRMVADDGWKDCVAEVVRDYGDQPALFGYFLQDEPNYRAFAALGSLNRELQKRDPRHLAYINLFPTYAKVQQLGTPTYRDYLDRYLRIVRPAVLSYDHYCLLRDGRDRPDYFENLELIRAAGLMYHTPPWNIILSLGHLGYRGPSEGEMRWQVYTSLAYGMKGIAYFTYWTEKAWEAQGGRAIVDCQGKPARLYPIVQQMNAEILALGKTLLKLTSTGVFHTGDIPPAARRLGTDSVVRVPDALSLLLGFFTDRQGGEYVFLVNRDHDRSVAFTAKFLPHVETIGVFNRNTGIEEPRPLTRNACRFSLRPGGGVLVRLHTRFAYPEPAKPTTEIDFQFDEPGQDEGWTNRNGLSTPVVDHGVLTMAFAGDDPYVSRSLLRVPADRYTAIKVRMRLESGSTEGQFFWTTQAEPSFRDDKYVNFPVVPDGRWHVYEIPVGNHPKWRGRPIRAIRLDPVTGGAEPGTKVQIDWIAGE